jgi:hypothetical protein
VSVARCSQRYAIVHFAYAIECEALRAELLVACFGHAKHAEGKPRNLSHLLGARYTVVRGSTLVTGLYQPPRYDGVDE